MDRVDGSCCRPGLLAILTSHAQRSRFVGAGDAVIEAPAPLATHSRAWARKCRDTGNDDPTRCSAQYEAMRR